MVVFGVIFCFFFFTVVLFLFVIYDWLFFKVVVFYYLGVFLERVGFDLIGRRWGLNIDIFYN